MPHKVPKSRAVSAGCSYDLVSDCCQAGQSDIIELDKKCHSLLECRSQSSYSGKGRGCKSLAVPPLSMGTKPAYATVRFDGWEGTGSRMNHEPEDLPGTGIFQRISRHSRVILSLVS